MISAEAMNFSLLFYDIVVENMKKIIRFAAAVCAAAVLVSCKETSVIDHKVMGHYSVRNLLDESLTISGTAHGSQFSIVLDKGETYTYMHELMGDYVEEGKIPIFLADPIMFEGKTSGIREYSSTDELNAFVKRWKQIDDGPYSVCLVLDVGRSFFTE